LSGYIDLHNHILPAIDDGPRTMEEAVKLSRDLVKAGYNTVVATPHSGGGRPAPELILQRIRALQEELNRQEIPLKLLPGSEQHIEPGVLELLKQDKILTLNRSAYLLLELPMFQPLPLYTEQVLFTLAASGYRPVIPHPERVIALQMNHQMLFKLHRAGAIYQVTWAAFSGKLGPAAGKTARFMLHSNLVHLLATDAHHPGSPQLTVAEAADYLDCEMGEGYSEFMLTTRPRLLLDNKPLDLPEPVLPGRRPPRRVPFLSRLFRA